MARSALRSAPILALTFFASAVQAQLTVGAALELKPSLEDVRKTYTERTGNPLRTIYASPSALVERATQGGIDCILAPQEWIDSALARGLSKLPSEPLGTSPMAVWSRQGSALPDSQLAFLLDSTIHGIGVSDPSQSPDGARAMPFLEALGADSSYRAKFRIAPEPQGVLDTILAGRADAAILPQSAFWGSTVGGMGRQLLLDSTKFAPQHIGCLVLNGPMERQDNARHFLGWARGPQGKGAWRRKGFLVP